MKLLLLRFLTALCFFIALVFAVSVGIGVHEFTHPHPQCPPPIATAPQCPPGYAWDPDRAAIDEAFNKATSP